MENHAHLLFLPLKEGIEKMGAGEEGFRLLLTFRKWGDLSRSDPEAKVQMRGLVTARFPVLVEHRDILI